MDSVNDYNVCLSNMLSISGTDVKSLFEISHYQVSEHVYQLLKKLLPQATDITPLVRLAYKAHKVTL